MVSNLPAGTPVGQGGNLTRVTYTISVGGTPAQLTGTESLTIKFYNGPTQLMPTATYMLDLTSLAQGYLLVNGPFGKAANLMPLTSGDNFRTTVTACGSPCTWTQTNVSLQVQTSYLPLGN